MHNFCVFNQLFLLMEPQAAFYGASLERKAQKHTKQDADPAVGSAPYLFEIEHSLNL